VEAENGQVEWVLAVGGVADDTATSVSVDKHGTVYVVGSFNDTAMFGSNETTLTSFNNFTDDMFLMKVWATGTVETAIRSGGPGPDKSYMLHISDYIGDGEPVMYVTGGYSTEGGLGGEWERSTINYLTGLRIRSPNWKAPQVGAVGMRVETCPY
jgi:hypothetical protein